MPAEESLAKLHARLGYKKLNRTWAKIEILLGLACSGGGLLLGIANLVPVQPGIRWEFVLAGLVLYVLGSYLALAGSRSHIYQSNNELAAYLVEEIHDLKEKVQAQ